MVYPHEKIQYIPTKEHAEVQDHATSPIFPKERTLDENKLLRETQARGYPTIAQTDYPYRNSKAEKSKRKEDIVNREYQDILEDISAADWEEALDSDSVYSDDNDNDTDSLATSDEDSSDGYKEFIGEFRRGKSRFKGKVKILKKQLEQGKVTKRGTKLRKSGRIPTCCNHNPDIVQQDKMTKEQRDPMGFYNIQPTQPPSQLLQPPPTFKLVVLQNQPPLVQSIYDGQTAQSNSQGIQQPIQYNPNAPLPSIPMNPANSVNVTSIPTSFPPHIVIHSSSTTSYTTPICSTGLPHHSNITECQCYWPSNTTSPS